MLRLGIADCDTSHVYQFARRLNHTGVEQDQWVGGARVVAAFPGTSRIHPPERIQEFLAALRDAGVTIVDRLEELLGQVDAVLVESNEGAVHRARATPFLEAGLPVFVDKPFAATAEDARAMVDLAARKSVPLLSASSLRFAPEVVAARSSDDLGLLVGADVYSPAVLHPANPGLLHYGVHGVETLYALLGPGCREVACISEEGTDLVTGRWRDGRIGVLRGLRKGARGYGLTAYGEKGSRSTPIDTTSIYRDLLQVVVPVLSREQPSPITAEDMIEAVAFQQAALASAEAGGKPVAIGGTL